ncbi:mitoferrin-1-like protein, partial [Dinothrombium tinctorium]
MEVGCFKTVELMFNDDESNEYESLPSYYSLQAHMISGAAAGICEHCVMFPVDSIKTRMQSLAPSPQATYRSVPEAMYKMMRYEGFFRPFRGMSVMVASAGPAHALYFSCYEKMKRVLSGTETGARHPLAQGAAGCLSTILHDAIMNPAEVVKQRLQMYNSPYNSALQCFLGIWKKEGFRAFYRSYTTSLSMNIPFQSAHLVTYEFMQECTNPNRAYNPLAHVTAGAVAGAVASAATTPLDVCKTLLNTQESQALRASKQSKIEGFVNAASTIYKCCGFRGYFNGLQARVIYTAPSTAISWSVYEFFKAYFNRMQTFTGNPSTPLQATRAHNFKPTDT